MPVETVEEQFRTLEELATSCGRHFMESLRLPPEDRAPEVFAGARSAHDRIHRLVGTFFGAYERGAAGIAAGRRERRSSRRSRRRSASSSTRSTPSSSRRCARRARTAPP